MTIPVADLPDIFGHTIFCDDIRVEQSGKFIYVGVYQGAMQVHVDFPVKLPKMSFAISIMQRVDLFIPNINIRISFPGDPEEAPSVRAEIRESSEGAFISQATSASELASVPPSERRWVALNSNMTFENVEIKQAGSINVRAEIGGKLYRLGSLPVGPAQKGAN